MVFRRLLILGTVLLLAACGKSPRSELDRIPLFDLGKWMTGSYTYAPEDGGRNVRLHIAEIWTSRDWDWLYAEWAYEDEPDKPLTQRIYLLGYLTSGEATLDVFRLPDAEKYVGAWHDPRRIDSLPKDDLVPLTGCSLALERDGRTRLVGGTEGRACKLQEGSEAYWTCGLDVTDERLIFCDQGFDAEGRRVSGPDDAGLVYAKTANGTFR